MSSRKRKIEIKKEPDDPKLLDNSNAERELKRKKIEPDPMFDMNSDDVEVWLVRKPTDVSIDDMNRLQSLDKFEGKTIIKDDGEVSVSCQFVRDNQNLFYVPTGMEQSFNSSKNLTAAKKLTGIILTSKNTSNELANSSGIGKIRQIPSVKSKRKELKSIAAGTKARLKPFGVIPRSRKKKYKLPNLT